MRYIGMDISQSKQEPWTR